jgi:regulator of nucleoside diphosphate kinase
MRTFSNSSRLSPLVYWVTRSQQVTTRDRTRSMRLKPHAALLREIDRATVISPKAALEDKVVTMNSQVLYIDEASGARQLMNIVYSQEAGGCACCVSVLAPVGTALIGLSARQAIEWDFPGGTHRCLRVERVIHQDCPLNVAIPAIPQELTDFG